MSSEKSDLQMMLECVGLFSKAGRVSSVRYPALKLKDQMLSGVTPTVAVDRIGLPTRVKARQHVSQQEVERLIAQASEGEDRDVRKAREPEKSAAFTSQSRGEREKATARRDQIPPVGAYNSHFGLVEKRVLTPNMHTRPKSQSRCSRPETPDRAQSSLLQSHVPSPVPFKKQAPRPNITSMSAGVNEGRFVTFNDMPLMVSKYKRVSTPDLSKSRARTTRQSKGFEPTFNTYNASYRLVQEDLGKVGIEFGKQRERQPILASQLHDLSYYDRLNFSQVEQRVTSPEFYRVSSRPEPSESPLPFFMRKVKSRASLNTLTDKGLEMNNFGGLRVGSLSASPQKQQTVHHSLRQSVMSSPSPKKMRSLNYSMGS